MKIYTFETQGAVPSGVVMHLTCDQAEARRHFLTPEGDWHQKGTKPETRLPFTANKVSVFIKGEEIGLDAEPDAALRTSLGVPPAGPSAPSEAKQKSQRLTKAEKKKVAEAEAAKADAEGKLDAQKAELSKLADAVVAAETTFSEAEAAKAALKDDASDDDKAKVEAALEAADKALNEAENAVLGFVKAFATPVEGA